MKSKISYAKLSKPVSEKLSEINGKIPKKVKDRISSKTIHPFWKKVRNVSGSVSGFLWGIYGFTEFIPIIPPKYNLALIVAATGTGLIAGGAHADKSKGKVLNYKQKILSNINKITKKS